MNGRTNNTGTNLVQVGGVDIRRIEYRGQQVVTFAMIDEVHGRAANTARKRFNDNRDRFVEGDDFITVNQPSEIRTLGFSRPQGGTPASVILITRRGYLKITKSLNDDKAWDVFDEMVDRYFAVEELPEVKKAPVDRTARETRLFMQSAMKLAAMAGLNGNQRLIAANRATRRAVGFDYMQEMGVSYLEAPQNDVLLNATTIGKELGGISAIKVNQILSEYGYQNGVTDNKGRPHWIPTAKGESAGGVMVEVERSNETGMARQLRWASSIVDELKPILKGGAA